MEPNFLDDILCCRDSIAIASLPDQEVAFLSGKFAAEFAHDLGPQWKLFDPIGNVHFVSYESNTERPFVSNGLLDIRKFYSLQGLNWCLLKYLGFSNFELFIYNDNIEEVCYYTQSLPPSITPPPVFGTSHSSIQGECTTVANSTSDDWIFYPCFFTCKLSPNQASSSQMNLPTHVYEYLRQGEVYKWIFRGPTGKKNDCKILGLPHKSYARFGRGWRAFCTTHELKKGDVLTFFFTSEGIGLIDVIIHSESL